VNPIESLDFIVFFSSVVTLVENVGQINYLFCVKFSTILCVYVIHRAKQLDTAVEGCLASYLSWFSLILPGTSNIGFLTRSTTEEENETLKETFGRFHYCPEGDRGELFIFGD
jgi:hypothetical protein